MRAFTKRESEIKIIDEEKNITCGVNMINVKGLKNEIADIKVNGITFANILGAAGERVASGASVSFDTVSGDVYYETLNESKFTGDGSTVTLTNGHTGSVDIAVYNLSVMGMAPNALATSYSADWIGFSEADLAEVMPLFCFHSEAAEKKLKNLGKNIFDWDSLWQYYFYGGSLAIDKENKTIGPAVNRKGNCRMRIVPNLDYTMSIKAELIRAIYGYNTAIWRFYMYGTEVNSVNSAISEGYHAFDFDAYKKDALDLHIDFYKTDGKISEFQLEKGGVESEYQPKEKAAVVIPSLEGTHAFYDTLEEQKCFKETVSVSSNSATVSHSGWDGTTVVLISADRNTYFGTVSGTTVSATVPDGDYSCVYALAAPISRNLPKKMPIYTGDNFISCEGAAISVTHTKESTANEILAFAEGIRITDTKSFYEYQKVNSNGKSRIETGKGYKISIDDLYLDSGWDERFESGKSFTLQITDDNDDETNVITTKYHGCVINSLSRTEDNFVKRGVEITAESKEII